MGDFDRTDPATPDIDERGVDRVQIRRMLDRTPLERLTWLEEFISDLVVSGA